MYLLNYVNANIIFLIFQTKTTTTKNNKNKNKRIITYIDLFYYLLIDSYKLSYLC